MYVCTCTHSSYTGCFARIEMIDGTRIRASSACANASCRLPAASCQGTRKFLVVGIEKNIEWATYLVLTSISTAAAGFSTLRFFFAPSSFLASRRLSYFLTIANEKADMALEMPSPSRILIAIRVPHY